MKYTLWKTIVIRTLNWDHIFISVWFFKVFLFLPFWSINKLANSEVKCPYRPIFKDVHRRQKLTTDFFQTFWVDYFGCDYLNFEKKICLPWFLGGGSFLRGLTAKSQVFSIFNSSDDRIFYNLKSTYAFIQDLDLSNKKNNSLPCRPEQEMFKERWANCFTACARSRVARFWQHFNRSIEVTIWDRDYFNERQQSPKWLSVSVKL